MPNNITKPDLRLGVNIDHVATLRQARMTRYPDPIQAAFEAEQGGADSITLHLREDRRHIQERDLRILKETCQTKINLEMAATPEMLAIAQTIRPDYCCLVPERRAELTTEGGLDVAGHLATLVGYCAALSQAGIRVALFIEANLAQIDAALATGVQAIEIHTGKFAEQTDTTLLTAELTRIAQAARYAHQAGLEVHAGHGLHYQNTACIAKIPEIVELNIGHAIIAQALFSGLRQAVAQMKHVMQQARK